MTLLQVMSVRIRKQRAHLLDVHVNRVPPPILRAQNAARRTFPPLTITFSSRPLLLTILPAFSTPLRGRFNTLTLSPSIHILQISYDENPTPANKAAQIILGLIPTYSPASPSSLTISFIAPHTLVPLGIPPVANRVFSTSKGVVHALAVAPAIAPAVTNSIDLSFLPPPTLDNINLNSSYSAKRIIVDGIFLNKVALYPRYKPPTPPARITSNAATKNRPLCSPACIRCLTTSLGTNKTDDAMLPHEAAKAVNGIRDRTERNALGVS